MEEATQAIPFGVLLKRFRRAAQVTQDVLAERAGYSTTYLSKLERGERQPLAVTVATLAEALGLDAQARAALERAAQSPPPSVRWQPQAPVPVASDALLPLVGRVQEQTLLTRYLSRAEPPVLLVLGEPGIGKTRLLQEAAQQGQRGGWRVLEGRCHRHSSQDLYAPLLGAIERHLAGQSLAEQREALKECDWLLRLLPELAEEVDLALPAWNVLPDQERRLLFAAVRRFLDNVSGPSGTLLVLDDLQWTSADTLDLLTSLFRSTGRRPLHIIGAYRHTEVRSTDPLSLTMTDIAREVGAERIELGPLAPSAAEHLLSLLLEGCAVDQEATLMETVLRRAGGMPYFLVSCAQGLRTGTLGGTAREAIPWQVTETIRQQVGALPEEAQYLLGAVAVAGNEARRPLLLTLATEFGWGKRDVLRALEQACQVRLLVEQDESSYAFAHDLVREVIAEEMSAVRRAILHQQVAEILEQEAAEAPVDVLAYHYTHAGELEKASLYLERAGNRAEALFAYAEAERSFREAAVQLEALGRPAEVGRIYLKWANMLRRLGRFAEMEQLIEGAIARYLLTEDLEALGHALWLLAQPGNARNRPQFWLARIEPLLLEFQARGASGGLAWLYNARSNLYLVMGSYREQLDALLQGERYLPATSDAPFLRHVMQTERGGALTRLGQLKEGKQLLEALLPEVAAAARPRQHTNILVRLAVVDHYQGRFAEEQRLLDQACAEAERSHDTLLIGFLAFRGRNAFYRGDWAAARTDLQESLARFRQVGLTYFLDFTLAELGRVCQAEGQREGAARYLQEALALCEPMRNVEWLRQTQSILAEGDLLDGHPEQARQRLLPVLDRSADQEPDVTALLPLLAWAHLDAGDLASAETALEQAIARAWSQQMRPALANALLVQVRLAARQRRYQEAEESLEATLKLCREIPYPYAEAKTLSVAGLVSGQQGETAQARERYEAALTILHRLGERLYADVIQQALEQLPLSK